jgi:hypothetical protein
MLYMPRNSITFRFHSELELNFIIRTSSINLIGKQLKKIPQSIAGATLKRTFRAFSRYRERLKKLVKPKTLIR